MTMRAALCAVAVLTGGLSLPALGDEAVGDDEVTLKDGGVLRGTVITQEPDLGLKLKVFGEPEPRFIPSERVEQVVRGKYAAPRPAPGLVAPASPDALGTGRTVRLHVESPVRLEVRSHAAGYYTDSGVLDVPKPVCVSPCDQPVDADPGLLFTVGADGVNESLPFSLNRQGGSLNVAVSPGRRSLSVAGLAVSCVGAAGLAAGLALTLSGLAQQNVQRQLGTGSGSAMVPLGATALGLGVAAMVTGIVLVFMGRTTLDLHEGP